MGPDATYKKPISSAIFLYASKASGVRYSATARCLLVGRMYCPKVTTSTSASRSSLSAFTTCGLVSPRPSMMDVFVISDGTAVLASRSTAMLWSQFARRSLTSACSSGTVSTLCAKTSSPDSATSRTRPVSPLKSGVSASTSRAGADSFSRRMVSAK